VLIVSEEAGLGKTTILLKLIGELTEQYGKNFKYAFIDHPTLTASQMIEQITGAITGEMPTDDKLKNLKILKEALIETKKEGGKNIIVIDEGQMLCGARDVLQELRALINLTHNNEYLHTFIISGQKALWDELQGMPEFWQRLPVRYFFTPLRFEETRELIRYRLNKAGLDVARDIFTEEAVEIIHKYSKGLPRTIIAVSDLALLNGFTDRTRKIGFKEVSKAINAMTGKGDSLSYIMSESREEREPVTVSGPAANKPVRPEADARAFVPQNIGQTLRNRSYMSYAIIGIAIVLFVFLGALGYRLLSPAKPANTVTAATKATETPVIVSPPETQAETNENQNGSGRPDVSGNEAPATSENNEKDVIAAYREERRLNVQRPPTKPGAVEKMPNERTAIVNKDAANVRSAPSVEAQRILTIVRGEMLTVIDEKTDQTGTVWYKVLLYNNREGWIADKVVTVTSKR